MALSARITSWPPYLVLALIVALLLAFAWAGIWLRRRFLSQSAVTRDREWLGILFSNIAVLYTVLVAFMVIGEWEEFNKAKVLAEQESAAVLSIARMVAAYPETSTDARRLNRSLAEYCKAVVDQEYPAMAHMRRSPGTDRAMGELWAAATSLHPRLGEESNVQQAILAQLASTQAARMSRLLTSGRGLPGILWVVVITSTMVTLAFSVFFATDGVWSERLMISGLVLVVALVLFAMVQLNYPFIGEVAVNAEGFQDALQVLR